MSVSSPILLANILRSNCSPSKQPHLLQPPLLLTTAATSTSASSHAPRSNMISASSLFHSNNTKRGRRRPRDSATSHLMSILDSSTDSNEIEVQCLIDAGEEEAVNQADEIQQSHKRARVIDAHSSAVSSLELASAEISPTLSPFDFPANPTAASLPLSFAAFSWSESEADRQWSCSPSTSPENTLSQSHTHTHTTTTRATSLDLLLANRGFPSSMRWIEDTDGEVDPDEAQRLLKRRRMLLLQPSLHSHAAIPATVLDDTVPAGGRASTCHAETASVNRSINFSHTHSTLSIPIASSEAPLSILSTTDSSPVLAASPFPHNYLRCVSDTMSTAAVSRILKYVYVFGEEYGHRTTGHSCVSREEIALAAAENHDLLYGECLPIGVTKLLDEAHLDARNAHTLVDLGSGIGKLALQAFMQFPNLTSVSGCELASSRFQKSVEAIIKMHEARESYRLHCATRPVRRSSLPHSDDDDNSQYGREDEDEEAEEEEEEEQKASCPDDRSSKRKSKHHLPQLLLSSSFHHNDEQLTSIRYSEAARPCPSKKRSLSKRDLHPHWHDLYAFESFVEDHEKASISLEQEKQLDLMRMLVGTSGASSSDSEDPPSINCLPPSTFSRPPSASNVAGEGDDNPLDPRRQLASQERVAKLLSVGYDRAYQASRDRLIHAATSSAGSAQLTSIPPTRTLELRCLNLFEMTAALTADIVICETKFTSDNYPALCNFLLQFKRGCRLLTYENLDAVFQHVYGSSTDKLVNQQLQQTTLTSTSSVSLDPPSKKKDISPTTEAEETATPKRTSKKKSKKSSPIATSISTPVASNSSPASAPSSRSSSFSSTDSSATTGSVARRTRHATTAVPGSDSASSVSTVAVSTHTNRESKRKRDATNNQPESSLAQPSASMATVPALRGNSHSSSTSPSCGSSTSNPTSASSTTYSCSTSSSSSSVSNSNSCVVLPHPNNPFRQLPINVSKSDRFFTSWASNVGHHFFLWKKVE